MTDRDKVVVLSFDEVKVKSVLEYDVGADQVLGKINQMQVCMARGLFASWKQSIYIVFDQRMTKELLIEIIAMVSDCGSSNIGLWKELGININKTFFTHPKTGKNIHVFADSPHLLKLLRNWFLDNGFTLADGRTINKLPVVELINITDKEVSICYKISKKHIDVENSRRQKVRLAAQLFSRTNSIALKRYNCGPNQKLTEDVGEFIDPTNSWFDIFNSFKKKSRNSDPLKNPYGFQLDVQDHHLSIVEEWILNMRANGKKSLQVFQNGMIISIRSLKLLLCDIKSNFHDVYYICTNATNKLNEHPSPLESRSHQKNMRLIILGKNPGILQSHVDTGFFIRYSCNVLSYSLSFANVLIDEIFDQNDESVECTTVSNTISSLSTSSLESYLSTSNSTVVDHVPEVTNDALEYIAGYLAKKIHVELPQLGQFTHQLNTDHAYALPSWVQQLSFGGLIQPESGFLEIVKRWNKTFEKFHGSNKLCSTPLVVKTLSSKIVKLKNATLISQTN